MRLRSAVFLETSGKMGPSGFCHPFTGYQQRIVRSAETVEHAQNGRRFDNIAFKAGVASQ